MLQFIYFLIILPFSYLLYLSLLDLTLASDREGIHNPFSRWVQVFVSLCRCIYWGLCVPPTVSIPWFLTKGNTYLYFAASPFPLQGENQHKLKKYQEEFLAPLPVRSTSSQDIPSTHNKLSSLALHYFPFASHLPLPHLKNGFRKIQKYLPFYSPSFRMTFCSFAIFACVPVCLLFD